MYNGGTYAKLKNHCNPLKGMYVQVVNVIIVLLKSTEIRGDCVHFRNIVVRLFYRKISEKNIKQQTLL